MTRYERWVFAAVVMVMLSAIAGSQSPVGVSAPAGVQSMILPATSERSSVFSYKGTTFIVGLTTGKVTVVDGSAPQPVIPTPGPVVPPSVPLTGLSKQVWDSLTSSPVDAQNRVLGAKALIGAIDTTLGEVGGLGIEDCQQIIDRLATNAEAARVNEYLRGWQLGTLLSGAKIANKDQLIQAFEEIKTGLQAVRP